MSSDEGKLRTKHLVLSVCVTTVTALLFKAVLAVQSMYGLYAYSSDPNWRDSCDINYQVFQIESASLKVKSRQFVLIKKHKNRAYLLKLKRKYSRDGLDQADGRVKLSPCRLKTKQENSNLDLLIAPTSQQKKSTHDLQSETNTYYVQIYLQLFPQGHWPYRIKLSQELGNTFIAHRRLQCAYGPVFLDQAKQVAENLRANQINVINLLAGRLENNGARFINPVSQCIIKDKEKSYYK